MSVVHKESIIYAALKYLKTAYSVGLEKSEHLLSLPMRKCIIETFQKVRQYSNILFNTLTIAVRNDYAICVTVTFSNPFQKSE